MCMCFAVICTDICMKTVKLVQKSKKSQKPPYFMFKIVKNGGFLRFLEGSCKKSVFALFCPVFWCFFMYKYLEFAWCFI